MNITVPTSMVMNDQVNSTKASGCRSIRIPRVMSPQATSSMGPRRRSLGHPLAGAAARAGGVGECELDIEDTLELLLAYRTECDAPQQMLAHQNREEQNGCQEQGRASRDCGPVLPSLTNDDGNEGGCRLRFA